MKYTNRTTVRALVNTLSASPDLRICAFDTWPAGTAYDGRYDNIPARLLDRRVKYARITGVDQTKGLRVASVVLLLGPDV